MPIFPRSIDRSITLRGPVREVLDVQSILMSSNQPTPDSLSSPGLLSSSPPKCFPPDCLSKQSLFKGDLNLHHGFAKSLYPVPIMSHFHPHCDTILQHCTFHILHKRSHPFPNPSPCYGQSALVHRWEPQEGIRTNDNLSNLQHKYCGVQNQQSA